MKLKKLLELVSSDTKILVIFDYDYDMGMYDPVVLDPSHYQGNGVECIDCIESAVSGLDGFHGFCAGNAIKYIFRFSHKNGVEDLRKAEWYIDRLIKAIPGRNE